MLRLSFHRAYWQCVLSLFQQWFQPHVAPQDPQAAEVEPQIDSHGAAHWTDAEIDPLRRPRKEEATRRKGISQSGRNEEARIDHAASAKSPVPWQQREMVEGHEKASLCMSLWTI